MPRAWSGTASAVDTGLPRADHAGPTARDVMVRCPKVLPAGASVGEVAAALAGEHVHMVLLVDGDTLVGTVTGEDLHPGLDPASPAVPRSRLVGRTVAPGAPAEAARRRLVESGRRRLAVVDADGALLGLLCLKRRRTGFCSDDDVAARSGGVRGPRPGRPA